MLNYFHTTTTQYVGTSQKLLTRAENLYGLILTPEMLQAFNICYDVRCEVLFSLSHYTEKCNQDVIKFRGVLYNIK
jgi:hypothetical protein